MNSRFRKNNQDLAAAAVEILTREQPMTLRGLFYQVVSAGHLPSTEHRHYRRLALVVNRLRESGQVPMSWVVDNVRSTLHTPSWSGLGDFVNYAQKLYRKSLWAACPEYPEIICEKDALAGTIHPITHEFDIRLRICRGYASLSYLHDIAQLWRQIKKPIVAYYLGDFDPSGMDIERDLREKLRRYSGKSFEWTRLAVNPEDIERFALLPLKLKTTDARARTFARKYGTECVEVDALRSSELRYRVRQAIMQHVDTEALEQIIAVETQERELLTTVAGNLKAGNLV